jgi:hypothetical protein
VHQRKSLTQGGALKVVEHLGGKTVQRRAHGRKELFENFVRLCQEGIE